MWLLIIPPSASFYQDSYVCESNCGYCGNYVCSHCSNSLCPWILFFFFFYTIIDASLYVFSCRSDLITFLCLVELISASSMFCFHVLIRFIKPDARAFWLTIKTTNEMQKKDKTLAKTAELKVWFKCGPLTPWLNSLPSSLFFSPGDWIEVTH